MPLLQRQLWPGGNVARRAAVTSEVLPCETPPAACQHPPDTQLAGPPPRALRLPHGRSPLLLPCLTCKAPGSAPCPAPCPLAHLRRLLRASPSLSPEPPELGRPADCSPVSSAPGTCPGPGGSLEGPLGQAGPCGWAPGEQASWCWVLETRNVHLK